MRPVRWCSDYIKDVPFRRLLAPLPARSLWRRKRQSVSRCAPASSLKELPSQSRVGSPMRLRSSAGGLQRGPPLLFRNARAANGDLAFVSRHFANSGPNGRCSVKATTRRAQRASFTPLNVANRWQSLLSGWAQGPMYGRGVARTVCEVRTFIAARTASASVGQDLPVLVRSAEPAHEPASLAAVCDFEVIDSTQSQLEILTKLALQDGPDLVQAVGGEARARYVAKLDAPRLVLEELYSIKTEKAGMIEVERCERDLAACGADQKLVAAAAHLSYS